MKRSLMARLRPAAENLGLALVVVVFLAPVVWLAATAYKPPVDIFSLPPKFFFTPTLENFRVLYGLFDVPLLVRNSLAISLGTTALALLLGVPGGYALARSRSRHAATIAYCLLA